MNSYSMRAFTLDGELYEFKVTDVPTRITEKEFILALKPGSPILLIDEITRGTDLPHLFEGDIIEEDNIRYIVNYSRGFRAIAENRQVKYLYEFKEINVVGSIYNSKFPIPILKRKKILFKYRDLQIPVMEFSGSFRRFAVIAKISDRVDPSELQQEAGFQFKGERIFFGDLILGYPVELYYGRPVIKTPTGIYDIVNKKILGGY